MGDTPEKWPRLAVGVSHNRVTDEARSFKPSGPAGGTLVPMVPTIENTDAGRALPQIGRVRRGWMFRDRRGCGWWFDDTVVTNGAHRVVPIGDPAAQCRVFTPVVGARDAGRRIYRFVADDDHRVSLGAVELHLSRASPDPPKAD